MLKKIITAKHRGFCAGVDRAVEIVEKSLIKYGAPVYVRHEIVHNKFVVNNFPSIANLIELNPKLKPDSVIKFGKSDLRFIFFIGLVQCCKHTFSGYNFITNFAIYSCIQGHVNVHSRSKSN